MPNEFQSIQSGAGMLKNNYEDEGDSPLQKALQKKLASLADTKRQVEPPGSDEEK